MATDKDIIVAIELGSSSIRGIAGRKNVDGTLHILDIVERKSKGCIRKGVIYNLDKTIQTLNSIFIQLKEDLKVNIDKAYVGIAGQSLCTVRNSASKQMGNKVVISADIVDFLFDSNTNANYPDREILEVRTQEYRIGTNYVTEPIGILSNQIEGKFLNIIARTSIKENIQKCFDAVGVQIIEMFISPLVLADNILTDNEKRSGCALVDFGAETTTVVIFKNNILRYLSVVPLGGNNITLDICSKQVEEEEAEDLKIKYGTAFSETGKELTRYIPTSFDPKNPISEEVLQEITEARMEEIIANMWEQIQQSGFADKLNSGIIITGGAANIKNIDKAISYKTKMDKIKLAKSLHTMIALDCPESLLHETNTNTLISLLASGEESCVEKEAIVTETTGKIEEKAETEVTPAVDTATPQTQDSKIEEKTEEKEKAEETPKKKKKGMMHSVKRKFIQFTRIFTEPEE